MRKKPAWSCGSPRGDKLTGIEIKMVPQAVLSGRVLDPDGDPWTHATIGVFHSVWRKGRRQLEFYSDSIGASDEYQRGEYRIAGLRPGRYYLLATPDDMWERQHRPDVDNQPAIRQQSTWYPSSPDVESAIPIALSAGQQLSGIDVRLRRGAGSKTSHSREADRVSKISQRSHPAKGNSGQRYRRNVLPPCWTRATATSGAFAPMAPLRSPACPRGHSTFGSGRVSRFRRCSATPRSRLTIATWRIFPSTYMRHRFSTGPCGSKAVRRPSFPAISLEPAGPVIDYSAVPKDDGEYRIRGPRLGPIPVYVQEPARRQVYLKDAALRECGIERWNVHFGVFGESR